MTTAPEQPTPPRYAAPCVLGGAFVLLWCTGYPAGKIALGHAAPFTLLVLRFACACVLYSLLGLLGGAIWPRWRVARHSLAVGMLSLAMQFGGVYLGIALGASAGIAALMIGTLPIATALLGRLIGESVRGTQWLGFALGFAGVALVVGDRMDGEQAGIGAYVALLVGLFGVSAGTLYQKRFGSAVDLRAGLALQHASATLLLLPFAWHEGFRFDATSTAFSALAWLVLVNSIGGFALLFLLLRRGAATAVAALFFLMPPVTAVMDYFVLGEHLSLPKLAGFALAVLGVYLGTRQAPPLREMR